MTRHLSHLPPASPRAAIVSFLRDDRFHEAEAAARSQALARPHSVVPRRLLAEALVALGDMPGLNEVLTDIRSRFGSVQSGQVRTRCLARLVAQHRYAEALEILDRHAGGETSPDLLLPLLPMSAHPAHGAEFLRRVEALTDGEARTALRSQVAAEACDLRGAEVLLDEVPEDHPLHRATLRRAFGTAQRLHDARSMARLGSRMGRGRAGDDDLELLAHGLRAAAGTGRMEVANGLFARLGGLMAGIRASDERFRRHWRTTARLASEFYDVEASDADLLRAERAGWLRPGERLGAEAARGFTDRHAGVIAAARTNLRALLAGDAPSFPADELVRVQSATARLLVIAKPHALDPMLCWLAVVGESIAQARAAGGSVTLVPDWLGEAAAAHRAAPIVLSYHTTGRAPGLVHFKEADLPGYVSLDPNGYAGWSRLADRRLADLSLESHDPKRVGTFFEAMRRSVLDAGISKYAQPGAGCGAASLPGDYVLVALQIPTDTVQALARVPMVEMLRLVARRFAGTGIRVVAKRHPLCRDARVAHALGDLAAEGAILLRGDNIHDLIAGARAVITVNSGVGSEALLHLKPVYLFGRADYAAVAHEVMDEEDFRARTDPIRLPVPEDTVKRFLFHYRRIALVDVRDPRRLGPAIRSRVIEKALARTSPRSRPATAGTGDGAGS